uniref:Centrosomal protein of 78 kDa isoform X2 n=1 Tax=Petromyzon marinus TaxID=7757 RepID=A0AAJ7TV24_PETMA|nr:centrosomal protein of 78 kDa isoform X2 [Petromyzon marinus]
MLASVQARRRGALDLGSYYAHLCALQDCAPLPAVTAHLARGGLDLHGDRVRLADWTPVANALHVNRHLSFVCVRSGGRRADAGSTRTPPRRDSRLPGPAGSAGPPLHSRDVTARLSQALGACLAASPVLTRLELTGLPLRPSNLLALAKGIAQSSCLETLSLANCPMGDGGLETICRSAKGCTSLVRLDVSGCGLSWRGAAMLSDVITHQARARHGEAWAGSLRYGRPDLERMAGLRRVSLNRNPLVGDRGAAALALALADDLWVKAVDMQQCGVGEEGARAVLHLLESNSALSVVDLRGNPLVERELLQEMLEKLFVNSRGETAEFEWLPQPAPRVPSPVAQRKKRLLHLGSRAKGRAVIRTAVAKQSKNESGDGGRCHAPTQDGGKHVPWRSAARATRATHSQGARSTEAGGASSVQAVGCKRCQQLQGQLQEERRAREAAELRVTQLQRERLRLQEINSGLASQLLLAAPSDKGAFGMGPRGSRAGLIGEWRPEIISEGVSDAHSKEVWDEPLLSAMEASVHKFSSFLDLLRDAGLGELASIAGIDSSDLRPFGCTSSLVEGVAASRGHGDAAAEVRFGSNAAPRPGRYLLPQASVSTL